MIFFRNRLAEENEGNEELSLYATFKTAAHHTHPLAQILGTANTVASAPRTYTHSQHRAALCDLFVDIET